MLDMDFLKPKCGHQFCAPHQCRFTTTSFIATAPDPGSVRYPDFRDGPERSRPEHDLDTFGRPLKPGT